MSAVEVCECILIIAGAGALVCLSLVFLKLINTLAVLNTTLEKANTTLDKANYTIDDINHKLDVINRPFDALSRFLTSIKSKKK